VKVNVYGFDILLFIALKQLYILKSVLSLFQYTNFTIQVQFVGMYEGNSKSEGNLYVESQ